MSISKGLDGKSYKLSRPLASVIFVARPTFKEYLKQVLQRSKNNGGNCRASKRKKEPWKEQNYGYMQ